MITPIYAMTIEQICERKYDLLVSADDVYKLSLDKRRYEVNAFAERLKEAFLQEFPIDCAPTQPCYFTMESVVELINAEAEKTLVKMRTN